MGPFLCNRKSPGGWSCPDAWDASWGCCWGGAACPAVCITVYAQQQPTVMVVAKLYEKYMLLVLLTPLSWTMDALRCVTGTDLPKP